MKKMFTSTIRPATEGVCCDLAFNEVCAVGGNAIMEV